jgi:hypothetical protein
MRFRSIPRDTARARRNRGRLDQDEAAGIGKKPNGSAPECTARRQHKEDQRPEEELEKPSLAPASIMVPTFLQIVLPKHVVSVLFAFIRVARALDRREDFPQA